jgi:hypothetical protein
MNICAIDATAATIVIACEACGTEAATSAAACTIVDEHMLAIPCSTPGCDRVTFSPRQRAGDDAAAWDWEHNRAMNFAFALALRNGAAVGGQVNPAAKARLAAEGKGAAKRRFPHEAWQDWPPGRARVASVDDELAAEQLAAEQQLAAAGEHDQRRGA